MPLFGDFGTIGNVLWIVVFLLLIFVYPRLMIAQMLWKLDQTVRMLESFTYRGKNIVIKKITKKPSRELREKITNFLEFFAIEPVSLDPYGIINKLDHTMNLVEFKFKNFTKKVAPKTDEENRANIAAGLSGAISLNMITKIVRHFVELIRKTKSLQLAMILQMQLPLIERLSKALLNGTEVMANGWPVGDSVGPLVAAHLIGNSKGKEVDETLIVRKKIKGREVLIVKGKGPGARLGKIPKIVENEVKKGKVAKIISIDAASKLEGEKTGSVAEGVGVALGRFDRAFIENIATKKDIPIESIVIKMSPEEAIMHMPIEVLRSVPKVVELVENSVSETRGKGKIIVMGVGNTSGVGNNKKSAGEAEKKAREVAQMMKRREEEEKPKRKWFSFGI